MPLQLTLAGCSGQSLAWKFAVMQHTPEARVAHPYESRVPVRISVCGKLVITRDVRAFRRAKTRSACCSATLGALRQTYRALLARTPAEHHGAAVHELSEGLSSTAGEPLSAAADHH